MDKIKLGLKYFRADVTLKTGEIKVYKATPWDAFVYDFPYDNPVNLFMGFGPRMRKTP